MTEQLDFSECVQRKLAEERAALQLRAQAQAANSPEGISKAMQAEIAAVEARLAKQIDSVFAKIEAVIKAKG
jgi:hypothetical protein